MVREEKEKFCWDVGERSDMSLKIFAYSASVFWGHDKCAQIRREKWEVSSLDAVMMCSGEEVD